ncbi:phage tail assembly protein [Paraburkholderia sp. BR10936]|uniref:phage tail assembly protein n=1 Tax=Paraburkholderia sp. BR10936 TaxID=3236993 RepID=UPI0034D15EE4
MTAKKLPEYLKLNDDGSINITLSRAITVNSATLGYVTMREPSVNDHLVGRRTAGTEEDKEIALFGNLCTLTPADIGNVKLRDYVRMQEAYACFTD